MVATERQRRLATKSAIESSNNKDMVQTLPVYFLGTDTKAADFRLTQKRPSDMVAPMQRMK